MSDPLATPARPAPQARISRRAFWVLAAIVAVLIALTIGGSIAGNWETILLWLNRVPFDPAGDGTVVDPVFGRDIGFFLFVPLEVTTDLIKKAGFQLVNCKDVTANIESVSRRWHASRQRHRQDLVRIEGEERFEGLQKFFSTVYELTNERRLSRFVFLVEKQ